MRRGPVNHPRRQAFMPLQRPSADEAPAMKRIPPPGTNVRLPSASAGTDTRVACCRAGRAHGGRGTVAAGPGNRR